MGPLIAKRLLKSCCKAGEYMEVPRARGNNSFMCPYTKCCCTLSA